LHGNLAAASRLDDHSRRRINDLSAARRDRRQSGGIVMAIHRALLARGVATSTRSTSGNEIAPRWRTTSASRGRPEIRAIAGFIESIKHAGEFRTACNTRAPPAARWSRSKSALRGQPQGRARTPARSRARLNASTPSPNDRVVRVDTSMRWWRRRVILPCGATQGAALGALPFSGGLKGMMLSGRPHGLRFRRSKPRRTPSRRSVGVARPSHPLDAGFAALSTRRAYFRCVELMLADPNIDVSF